jgi:hypothetical protein
MHQYARALALSILDEMMSETPIYKCMEFESERIHRGHK